MKRQFTYANGAYLVMTTRRAAHTQSVFAKATIYVDKLHYDNGTVAPSFTIESFYLCEFGEDQITPSSKLITSLKEEANTLVEYARSTPQCQALHKEP